MPKFSNAERILVKSIVASLSIKRIPEKDIINEIYNQTNKTLTQSGLFYVKKAIKKESGKWYKTMREGEYEYIHQFKERIDEIINLQKKHHEIVDSPTEPTTVKQASLIELHKLSITLSNLYDVAPTIIGVGNDATISTASEVKTSSTETERSIIV
jgi:hypothetical protein